VDFVYLNAFHDEYEDVGDEERDDWVVVDVYEMQVEILGVPDYPPDKYVKVVDD